MDTNKIIGNNLARLRKERHFSLGQLAEKCEVSKVALSQIEKGEANPTINTIWKIAKGLSVPYTELLNRFTDEVEMLKKEDVLLQTEDVGKYRSYSYYNATPERNFDFFVIEIDANSKYESEGHLVGTKEYLIVNQGKVTVLVENQAYELEAGDSVCFNGDKKHTYVNNGEVTANCTTLVSY